MFPPWRWISSCQIIFSGYIICRVALREGILGRMQQRRVVFTPELWTQSLICRFQEFSIQLCPDIVLASFTKVGDVPHIDGKHHGQPYTQYDTEHGKRSKSQPTVYEAFDLKVIYEVNRTGFEEHKDYPIRMHAIIAGRYQILEYLGSAAFSRAVQCVDLKNGQLVCVKIIRNNKDFFDQVWCYFSARVLFFCQGSSQESMIHQIFPDPIKISSCLW